MSKQVLNRATQAALKLFRQGRWDAAYDLVPDLNDAARASAAWILADPQEANAHFLSAEVFRQLGNTNAAIQAYRVAISLERNHLSAHCALAAVLLGLNDANAALSHCDAALAIDSSLATMHYNRALALDLAGDASQAISAYRLAVRLDPDLAQAQLNLGVHLHATGDLDGAEDCLREAIRVEPAMALAHANLATVLKDQGFVVQALAAAKSALASDLQCSLAWSNAIFFQPYLTNASNPQMHAIWLRGYQGFMQAGAPAPPRRSTARRERIRVGYMSADFKQHAVTHFFEPVLAHHDRTRFEVFCYDFTEVADDVSIRLRRAADVWRPCKGLNDSAVSSLMVDDCIDVLVDMMGPTAGNRASVVMHRPAPLQLAWLGWPASSGLPAIDFHLADRYLCEASWPAGTQPEQVHALPETWLCYRPEVTAPAVNESRGCSGERVRFGSFNGVYKIGDAVIDVWAALLQKLPSATLLIAGVPPGRAEARLRRAFERRGVWDRIEVLRPCSLQAFFAAHSTVDIALDPFPFNGSTTTLHSLWMGVPVVTLAGNTHASRMGYSIMRNIGAERLIAHSEREYLTLAADLAGDAGARQAFRSELRHRLSSSPLMDEARFTRALEAAYLDLLCTKRDAGEAPSLPH